MGTLPIIVEKLVIGIQKLFGFYHEKVKEQQLLFKSTEIWLHMGVVSLQNLQ